MLEDASELYFILHSKGIESQTLYEEGPFALFPGRHRPRGSSTMVLIYNVKLNL